jgi:hypothetical protein
MRGEVSVIGGLRRLMVSKVIPSIGLAVGLIMIIAGRRRWP